MAGTDRRETGSDNVRDAQNRRNGPMGTFEREVILV